MLNEDDLASVEISVLESQRKIDVQARMIEQLRAEGHPLQLAERQLRRLQDALSSQKKRRDLLLQRAQFANAMQPPVPARQYFS